MSYNLVCLDTEALARALSLRDLTDERLGPHAMQVLLADIERALGLAWQCQATRARACPVVWTHDNYDALGYPPDAVARDARYTRYLSPHTILRTQTSAMIPPALRTLAAAQIQEVLLSCPGLVYRRDCIDRLHVGEPHQVDLWRLSSSTTTVADLQEMIALVAQAALPGSRWRTHAAQHPYTQDGLQIDVETERGWVEIGECGLADPDLLARSGLPWHVSGLAMGLGLDRLLMLRKGIDDIRLLRETDARVASQMLDLEPYRAVSRQPATTRDLSIAVTADLDVDLLGDRAREALGADALRIESLAIVSETSYGELPPQARLRIGMRPEHKNVLLRVVLRDAARSMPSEEANSLRDRIYAALHEGEQHQWAARQ